MRRSVVVALALVQPWLLAACSGGSAETVDTGPTRSDAQPADADAGGEDAEVVDLGIPDAGLEDAGPADIGPPDLGAPDAGLVDTGSPDLGVEDDAGPPDMGFADAAVDAGPPDMGFEDAAVDAGPPDMGFADAAVDAGPPDMGFADAAVDAGPPDSGVVDSGVIDAGAPDSGLADAGAPDSGPYAMVTGERGFMEVPPSGTPLGFFNQLDVTNTVALPFAFEYFGTSYPAGTLLVVTNNGRVFFGSGVADGNNTALPPQSGPTEVIAPFWDRLRLGWDAYATTNSAEVRIQWYLASDAATTSSSVTFQVRLIRQGNIIEFTYDTVTGPTFAGTIGISDASGQNVYQLPCSPNCVPAPGQVVTYYPTATPVFGYDLRFAAFTPALPSYVYVNEQLPAPVTTLENIGNLDAPATGKFYMLLAVPAGGPFANFGTPPTTRLYDGNFPGTLTPGQTATHTDPLFPIVFPSTAGPYDVALALDLSDPDVNQGNNLLRLGTIDVRALLGACAVTTTSLPAGTVGQMYDVQLAASGCPSPTWSVSTTLPAGLTLSPSGRLSGVPTAASAMAQAFEASERGYAPDTASLPLVIQ